MLIVLRHLHSGDNSNVYCQRVDTHKDVKRPHPADGGFSCLVPIVHFVERGCQQEPSLSRQGALRLAFGHIFLLVVPALCG